MDSVAARSFGVMRDLMTDICSLVRIGPLRYKAAVDASFGSMMLATLPAMTADDMTVFSRTPSIAGLVTWAKFSLK